MKAKILTLGLICLFVFLLPYCSEQDYYKAGIDGQTRPLNDIAFKILDKKAAQPIAFEDLDKKVNRRAKWLRSYTNYRYVVIGDVRPQWERCGIELLNPIFISLLGSIASLNPQPDFIMILGDLVCRGKEIEYQSYYNLVSNWMQATDIAVFAVPGNHEFLEPNSFELYDKFIGDLDYCFDWKNSTFIILNDAQQPGDPQYKIEDFQLNFLSAMLKTAQSLKFVCTHIPHDGTWSMCQGYMEFLDILAEYNVTVSWEAHLHFFKRYWYNEILHIITGGGGADLFEEKIEYPPLFFNTKHHFLVVDVKRNRVEIKVFFYQEGYSSEDYNVVLDLLP